LVYGAENFGSAIYAMFVATWATIFLEAWKRKESELSWNWNGSSAEDNEDDTSNERIEFEGVKTFDEIDECYYKAFSFVDRLKRFAVTIPALFGAIGAIIIYMLLYFHFDVRYI